MAKGLFQLSSSQWSFPNRSEQDFVEIILPVVEPKFGLFEEGRKGLSAQAVELLVAAFGIAPEAFDPIDMHPIFAENRVGGVGIFSNSVVARKACFDEAIIAAKPVGRDVGLG